MATISMRIPENSIDDIKMVAPKLGFSGYQPLMRANIGQGLRNDMAWSQNPCVLALGQSLRRHGAEDNIISAILTETVLPIARLRFRIPTHFCYSN